MKVATGLLLALLLLAPTAEAGEARSGALTLTDAWLRLNIAGRPAAAYLAVRNDGAEDDRLLSVSTPLAVKAELHGHEMRDGQMQMFKLDAVDIPAGETVVFERGGLHVMIFGLVSSVEAGNIVPLTFTFEKAGPVGIGVEAKPLGGE